MVRKMPLKYIVLFEELLKITKKIAFNTVSQEIKQQLADATNSIIEDIAYVLHFTSKNGYDISKGKEFIIDLKFQSHQKRLDSLIEYLSIRKKCSKCERVFPRTNAYFYRDCNAKDGFRNDCKQCHKETQKELYHQKKKYSKDNAPAKEEYLVREEYENIIQK